MNHCFLSVFYNDNVDANSSNIIFTIKNTNYTSLQSLYQQKTVKNKYLNECKTRSKNKDTLDKYRYFLKSNFVGVNRLFVLIYSNKDNNGKSYTAKRYLPKGIIAPPATAERVL